MSLTSRETIAVSVAAVSALAAVGSTYTAFQQRDTTIGTDLFRERLDSCANLVGSLRSNAIVVERAEDPRAVLAEIEPLVARFEITAPGHLRETWRNGIWIHDLSDRSILENGAAWMAHNLRGMADRLLNVCSSEYAAEMNSG
ncbi:MAG: hypothetical protein AAF844_10905 [Pseudomonadota bacterium]